MTDHATNRVIVIGTLDAVREGKKTVAVSDARTRTGGLLDRFTLQVVSPYGEAFALPLTAAGSVRGGEVLAQAAIGQIVVVEGIARMYQDYDTRYAVEPDDRGRSYREMRLSVTEVRALREDEPNHGSFVWLEGLVAEPPRIIRHPSVPDLELAATLLTIEVQDASPYPGSRMTMRSIYQVPVMVPLNLPAAGLLYKQGNRVRVEGQFDRTIVPQRGAAVKARLDELEIAFQAEIEQLRGQVRTDAERRYRRNRRNLSEAPRATVLVGWIEGVAGEEIDLATAQQHRAIFTSEQRAQRKQRERDRDQVRRGSRPAPQQAAAIDETTSDTPIAPVSDDNVVSEGRPRRRPREETLVGALNGSEDS